MKPVLVDTDVIINFLRGKAGVWEFLVAQLEEGPIHCSVITIAEIHAGMRPHEKEKTAAFLDSMEVIDINRAIAEKAGFYKAHIKSHALELDDCLIAATAHVLKLTLAACNGKHYPMDDIQKVLVQCK